jgi:hypothetical protein
MSNDIQNKLNSIHDKMDGLSDTLHKVDKETTLQKAIFADHILREDEMFSEFRRMNDILQQNTDSLREHMRRTDVLEDIIQKMDLRFTPIEIAHIETQVIEKYKSDRKKKIKDTLMFWAKIAGGLSATIAIYMALKSIGH